MSSSESSNVVSTYMWRSLRVEGSERGELLKANGTWILRGTVLSRSDAGPAEARYEIVADEAWHTTSARVLCRDDLGEREIRITREKNRWYSSEGALELPKNCIDVDLSWSPSTNTLPIRRLKLKVGENSGLLTAAWIRMPQLAVEALDQTYERVGNRVYVYRSRGGIFQATLTTDEYDLVVNYAGVWDRVGPAT